MNNAMFYSWMSQASYLYFNNSQSSLKEDDSTLVSFLKDENWTPAKPSDKHPRADKLFSKTQAEIFTENYTFISHQPNTLTGMSSTVFQSKEDGSFTFAMRGTEPSAQGGIDAAIEDLTGVVLAGKAKAQLADAFHYYKRLTTPQGETVEYTNQEHQMMAKLLLDHSSSVGKFSTIEAAGTYIQNVLSNDIGLGEIEAGATINFAGHSLGGHLLH